MARFGLRKFGVGEGRQLCESEELHYVLFTANGHGILAVDDLGTISEEQVEMIVQHSFVSDAIPCDESVAFYVITLGKLYEILGKEEPWFDDAKVIAIVDFNEYHPRLYVAHMLFE